MSKQLKQLFYQEGNENIQWPKKENDFIFGKENNLIEDLTVYSFGIYSLPGNRFYFSEEAEEGEYVIIPNTGKFQMNVENRPIAFLSAAAGNKYGTYPTIIDLIYESSENTITPNVEIPEECIIYWEDFVKESENNG